MNCTIALVECKDYSIENTTAAVEEALRLLELDDGFFDIQGRILLKPNLIFRREPEKAVTTHPAILEAVIAAIRARNKDADICMGDSPGGALKRLESYWKKSGFTGVSEKTGVPLVSFDNCGSRTFPIEGFKGLDAFSISEAVLAPEMIVNLPKLKTHTLTYMTCAMKNLYGTIPGLQKSAIHKALPKLGDFARFLAVLNQKVKPALHIVDAVTGMEGNGPGAGDPKHLGFIIAGTNSIAVDMAAAQIIGIPFDKVTHIKEAVKLGLGPASMDQIQIKGKTIEEVRPDAFRLPSTYQLARLFFGIVVRLFRRLVWTRPKVNMGICIKCRKCIESCPVQAMELGEEQLTIDYKKCITCMCCHELCEENAVELEFSFLARLLTGKRRIQEIQRDNKPGKGKP